MQELITLLSVCLCMYEKKYFKNVFSPFAFTTLRNIEMFPSNEVGYEIRLTGKSICLWCFSFFPPLVPWTKSVVRSSLTTVFIGKLGSKSSYTSCGYTSLGPVIIFRLSSHGELTVQHEKHSTLSDACSPSHFAVKKQLFLVRPPVYR